MKIAITGASGLIGRELTRRFQNRGDEVVPLVRRSSDGIRWDPDAGTIDADGLEGFDAAIHLAGENIAGRRWNDAVKQRIRESRVRGTRLLCDTLLKLKRPPRVLLSASAVGYYGNRGDEVLDEYSRAGTGFLADVCQAWESASTGLEGTEVRRVVTRIGAVLTPKGGALAQMLLPFRLGLGGVVGSGQQYLSWVSLDDLLAAVEFLLDDDSCRGVYNLTSPAPATNREFTQRLGRALRRPTLLPLPAFAARLALGEMADGLLLASARVLPRRLEEAGFRFQDPELATLFARLFRS